MNHSCIIDRVAFDALVVELGAADTVEVLNCFLVDTAGKLARLSADGVASGVVRREAHSIKSSSATFGFIELSRLAQELEAGAVGTDPDALQGAVAELQRSFARICRLAHVMFPDIGEIAR